MFFLPFAPAQNECQWEKYLSSSSLLPNNITQYEYRQMAASDPVYFWIFGFKKENYNI